MKILFSLCLGVALLFSETHAAAASDVIARVNCVLEADGKVECHEGEDLPCMAFFDVRASEDTLLSEAVLAKLKELDILMGEVDGIHLEFFGIKTGESVHSGWRKISDEDVLTFWETCANVEEEGRDLNLFQMGQGSLSSYVIKVEYSTE